MQTLKTKKIRDNPGAFYFPKSGTHKAAILTVSAYILLFLGAICTVIVSGSHLIISYSFACIAGAINSIILLSAAIQSDRPAELSFNSGWGKHENLSYVLEGAIGLSAVIVQFFLLFNLEGNLKNFHFIALYIGFAFFVKIIVSSATKIMSENARNELLLSKAISLRKEAFRDIFFLSPILPAAYLTFRNLHEYSIYLEFISSLVLILALIFPSFQKLKQSVICLLDMSIPEETQYEILALIVENSSLFCEFKRVHAWTSGDKMIIELHIILPSDLTLEKCYEAEKKIAKLLREKFPGAVPRILSSPCRRDCSFQESGSCPFHKL